MSFFHAKASEEQNKGHHACKKKKKRKPIKTMKKMRVDTVQPAMARHLYNVASMFEAALPTR